MNNSNKELPALKDDKAIESEQELEVIPSIFASIRNGLVGFLIVFSLILFSKFLFNSINGLNEISFSISDLIISSWGFLVISFIVFVSKNRS